MKAFVISATRKVEGERFTYRVQCPTFYLLANVQGILSEEHACQVARDVLGAACDTVTAVAVEVGTYSYVGVSADTQTTGETK